MEEQRMDQQRTEMPGRPEEVMRPKDTPLFQEMRAFLSELGTNATPSDALTKYLAPRIFDRGMAEPLVVDGKEFAPVPIFSSGMAEQLRGLGYTSPIIVDINDMFGANQVSHAHGDRLIREVALKLHERFAGAKIMRLGGDEFIVWHKPTSSQERGRLSEQAHQAEQDIEQNVPFFSKKGEALEKKKASVDVRIGMTDRINKLIAERAAYHEDPEHPEVVMDSLRSLHPELMVLLDEITGWEDSKSQKALALILENALYDQVLQPHFNQELYKDRGIDTVAVYRDAIDFMQHAIGEKESRGFMKVELPGVLKIINDKDKDYDKGDRLIKDAFDRIVTVAGRAGITDLRAFRRGGDFYISYDAGGANGQFAANLGKEIAENFPENENLVPGVDIPVSPVVVFCRLPASTTEADIKQSMNELDRLAKDATYHLMYRKINSGDTRQTDYAERYFNPDDKRGAARLQDLGADDTMIDDLRERKVDFALTLRRLLGKKVA